MICFYRVHPELCPPSYATVPTADRRRRQLGAPCSMGSSLRLVVLGCILLTTLRVVAAASAPAANDFLVQTTSGLLQGFLDVNTTDVPLKKWLGVPYADDTSGANRWRPPQPVNVEDGQVINATAYGPACMQGRADGGNGTSVQSEDCLLINIIAPANASNLPVYIYV